MKSLALAVVMAVALGAAGAAAAQQAPSSPPEASQAPTDGKNTNVEVNIGGAARPGADASAPAAPAAPAPGAPAQTETKGPDLKSDNRQDTSKDDVAASPRSTGDRSMIFGLSPVTAVVIAAALLVVVILAIVAMTRNNNDTYIDTQRGL